jgi:hypothetical protein
MDKKGKTIKKLVNMKKTLLVLILFCQTVVLCAQSNYKPGYVITLSNDTVYGWIDFRTDNANSKMCRLKVEEKTEPTEYLPGEITGYRFTNGGKYYVSRDIVLNDINQKVFLEYLVQGIMNLYYYYNDQQAYYFFENESGEMKLVTRKPNVITNDELVVDTKYKGVVSYIFRDYQPIAQKSKDLKFNQKSFIGIAKKYHEEVCTTGEECIVFENRRPDNPSVEISVSAYAGMNSFDYSFYCREDVYASTTDESPAFGLGINFKNPRWSQSFSLQFDVYTSKHKTQTYKYLPALGGYSFDYKADMLFFSIGIKYEYPKYRLRPVAEIGMSHVSLINVHTDIYRPPIMYNPQI